MADWTLIPCLVRLRAEFDDIAPGRGRESDGTVGDTAHAGGGVSDHLPDEDFPRLRDKDADSRNEVHAIDVDADLRTPGLTMEQAVQHLLERCRSGAETRLRYVIYNRRIWEASNGWRQRAYDGPNPHDKHAHFSASYNSTREASTASWQLEDLVALTPADIDAIAERVWRIDILGAPPGSDPANPTWTGEAYVRNAYNEAKLARVTAQALRGDDVDEAAIVTGVLAGLDPAAIAAAIPLDIARRVADELAVRLAS